MALSAHDVCSDLMRTKRAALASSNGTCASAVGNCDSNISEVATSSSGGPMSAEIPS